MKRLIFAAALAAALPAAHAVTLGFETEILHSKSWFDWADCGDFPGLSSAPENVNMRWNGTLTFEPPNTGWFTTTAFAFTSDRTQPAEQGSTFVAYVSGFNGPIEGFEGGYATLFIDFHPQADYADKVMQLAMPYGHVPVTPVPEPGTWALLVAGLAVGGRIARRRA